MQGSFFPSRTMAWYVAKMFLVRSLSVLMALVLVLLALDLLGETDAILGAPGNGGAEIMHYVALRTPQIIARFLPFSVLLGTLIAMITLNQNSEVVSMKAAGLSAHQVLAPMIVASLFVAALAFAFNDRIVSRSTAELNRWQKVEYGPVPTDKKAQMDIWVRDGTNLINVETVTGRGNATRLEGITIYDRTSGELDSIIRAKGGSKLGTAWKLTGASRFDVKRGVTDQIGSITVGTDIRPDQFTLASVDADGLSFGALWKAVDDLGAAGRPTMSLRSALWHKISGPLSTLLMPLLAAVAAFGIARSGRLFVRAVIGMGLGFAYFVADNFGLAMGNLGAYPPLLAAWGPFFLFLLIGEFVLIRTEE
jgi:lipopolysaccharide export system permease protein